MRNGRKGQIKTGKREKGDAAEVLGEPNDDAGYLINIATSAELLSTGGQQSDASSEAALPKGELTFGSSIL